MLEAVLLTPINASLNPKTQTPGKSAGSLFPAHALL